MMLKKKILIASLLLFVIMSLSIGVRADAGGPWVISYDVIVTNKNGATCYNYNGSKYTKSNQTLAYGTVINIYEEFNNGYVPIWQDGCDYIKSSDVKTKKDSFSPNDESVEAMTAVKAVILAKGGLNLRKGPAVAYGKVTTIPQYSVVTLTHRGGDYWFYTKYNGKSGWISGINNYFGYDRSDILISSKDTPIYDLKDHSKKIGTIPAFTEVTDYIVLSSDGYYVSYNGIKGYAYLTTNKEIGEIKVLIDTNVYSGSKVIGTVKKGEVLEYSFQDYDDSGAVFNIPSLGGVLRLKYDNYKIVKEGVAAVKTKGFIGEGIFGEKRTIEPEPEPQNNPETDHPEEKEDNKKSMSKELIIICVLGSIILALTIIIIILLVNKKKHKNNVILNTKERVLEDHPNDVGNSVEVKEESVEQKPEENQETKEE